MAHRRALLAAGAAGALVLGGMATAALPASAATGCSIAYTVQSQWPDGFTANVAITNLGDPISSWTLTFDFPDASQRVTQGWSATWTQSRTQVSAASMTW